MLRRSNIADAVVVVVAVDVAVDEAVDVSVVVVVVVDVAVDAVVVVDDAVVAVDDAVASVDVDGQLLWLPLTITKVCCITYTCVKMHLAMITVLLVK